MKPIRFVLINPTSPLWRAQPGSRPRGSRYFRFSMLTSLAVAASMPPFVETRIVDEEIEPIDFDIPADLIGISFMTYNAPRAYEIADRFRKEKRKPVILGGYHPSFMPQEAIGHADAICIGDAEGNTTRMLEDFARGGLQPFYRCDPISLDGLPPINRSLIRKANYAPVDVLQATRGCHFRCSFCSVSAFHHHQYRTRPVGSVIDELKTLGPVILFMDDNLFGEREYARELLTAMLPLRKLWFSQGGIGIAEDEELLYLATRSGCRGLFIGFESLSRQNLRLWNKQSNLQIHFRAAADQIHRAGIGITAAFVFGGDDDSPDVFEQTLDFLLQANIEVLQATKFTPFPGTPIFERLENEGRIFDRDWSHYDFDHVVYTPLKMNPAVLDAGVGWVLRQFYARRSLLRRGFRSLGYLPARVVAGGMLPLNLGYRRRLTLDGSFHRGSAFHDSPKP